MHKWDVDVSQINFSRILGQKLTGFSKRKTSFKEFNFEKMNFVL